MVPESPHETQEGTKSESRLAAFLLRQSIVAIGTIVQLDQLAATNTSSADPSANQNHRPTAHAIHTANQHVRADLSKSNRLQQLFDQQHTAQHRIGARILQPAATAAASFPKHGVPGTIQYLRELYETREHLPRIESGKIFKRGQGG